MPSLFARLNSLVRRESKYPKDFDNPYLPRISHAQLKTAPDGQRLTQSQLRYLSQVTLNLPRKPPGRSRFKRRLNKWSNGGQAVAGPSPSCGSQTGVFPVVKLVVKQEPKGVEPREWLRRNRRRRRHYPAVDDRQFVVKRRSKIKPRELLMRR